MEKLLATALLCLPLATLASDPPARTDGKAATAAATSKESPKDARAAADSKAKAEAKAKDAKGQSKADAKKGDEKPCEPVKPCAID